VNATDIALQTGAYTLSDLTTAIQNAIGFLGTVAVNFSVKKNLITISADVAFSLDLTVNDSIVNVIGFEKKIYTGGFDYVGIFLPKLYDNAIYISCNFCTHMQTTTPALHNVSFIVPHNVNRGEIIQFYNASQFSLQPRIRDQTIGYIELSVFNEKGELLQGLGDWLIMFEIV
jgi:hypothetical protein